MLMKYIYQRYLPTKINTEIWKLEKEIHSMILEVVNQRVKGPYEKDLLQMILEGAQSYGVDIKGNMLSQEKFIVDNCKNIYFAGHETTAITASWSLMLLAANPDWQACVRTEVLHICKDGALPDADMLRNMKTVCSFIYQFRISLKKSSCLQILKCLYLNICSLPWLFKKHYDCTHLLCLW